MRREERCDADQCESLGADGGHAEHRVESAVDVRHELLLLVPEQRAQHMQHATRVRNTEGDWKVMRFTYTKIYKMKSNRVVIV